MNAVLLAVVVMLVLSLLRVHVVMALIIGSLVGGISAGMSLEETLYIFSDGLGGGATIALNYAILGAFAVAISRTSLPNSLVNLVIKLVGNQSDSRRKVLSKALIFLFILVMACFSQNLIPIHIAFIPILIPPIINILNELEVDRRAIASILTFGLIAPYMLLPYGFGNVFHRIVVENIGQNGLDVSMSQVTPAMVIPVFGMVIGLFIAVLFSYRKSRSYEQKELQGVSTKVDKEKSGQQKVWSIIGASLAIFITLLVQTYSESMIMAGLAGIIVLYLTRALKWNGSDQVLTDGMKMMAFISFVMISAAGFSEVIRETGHVDLLVEQVLAVVGESQGTTALLMLLVGLILTLGIGSAFSTVPILATIFVPIGMAVGFSPVAIIALIGTAGALGDAGAPASDSTLGPTAGLNADGQHNHIWDTCVPTFLHYNIPLIIFGWIAAMIL
ncbi:Na+/H+ antiporter family protein [Alkalihalobacillus pseudalcaliphilus]|uniref:Na+/H+ antiporter family protein n=1 Tax=Alkalihalobacillus pseudalcaliphilus TaxID=79884 RepID=UPI00064DE3A0|nr:Na+/H+ antiporter NhaC family protein [Alkalihalobacillus pseudalcaliphilus]KMK77681.1 sodium:proton antiporter [Alkalihalobacillus pseudalcaliphilus]